MSRLPSSVGGLSPRGNSSLQTPMMGSRSPMMIPSNLSRSPETRPPENRLNPFERMVAEINQLGIDLDEGVEYQNRSNLQWRDQVSIQKFYQILIATQRNPHLVDPNPGGKAIWSNPPGKTGGNYACFEIWDHRFPHLKPHFFSPHLKVTLLMPLKETTQKKLGKISSCICYNSNVGLVTVDAASLGGAIAELAILKMVNEGKINHWEAMKYSILWKPIVHGESRNMNQHENMYLVQTPFLDALERYILSD